MSFRRKGDSQKTTGASSTSGQQQTASSSSVTPQFPSFISQPLQRLIPGLEQQAGQAPQLAPEASGLLSGILGGNFLSGGGDFNLLMDEARRQILPGVISQFVGAGRGRSGLAGEAAARGLGSAFSGLVSGERQRQLQALPFAFAQANQAQAPFNQKFSLLNALLSAPVGEDRSGFIDTSGREDTSGLGSTTQTPGRLSTLGQIGRIAAPFVFGFSDRRLKKNIRRAGELYGLPAYEFEFIWGGPRVVGVMADEALKKHPEAVKTGPGGYLMVNYELLEARYG